MAKFFCLFFIFFHLIKLFIINKAIKLISNGQTYRQKCK